MRRRALIGGLVALVALALAPTAQASFHEVQIRQIHSDDAGAGDWVMLQMFSSGQNFVGGRYVRAYTNTGAVAETYQFPNGDCASLGIAMECLGNNQRAILVGNSMTVGGRTADANANTTLDIPPGSGAVCFLASLGADDGMNADEAIDCVAYGAFAGTFEGAGVIPAPGQGPFANSAVGTPVEGAGLGDMTTVQRSTALGCPTLLEGPDDTNTSVNDFAVSAAGPRNNADAPLEAPCTPPGLSPIAISAGVTPSVTSTLNQARCDSLRKKLRRYLGRDSSSAKKLVRKIRGKLRNAGCNIRPLKP